MTNELKMQRIKSFLKERMKQQGKSYEDLADHLNSSVSTVKRIMTKDEISLERLMDICEWLDLRMTDLFTAAESSTDNMPTRQILTEEQEEFLAADDLHYSVLVHVDPKMTPLQLSAKMGLEQRKFLDILWELEKLKLVKPVLNGKKYKSAGKFRLRNFGPLMQKYADRVVNTTKDSLYKKLSAWPTDADVSEILEREDVVAEAFLMKMQKKSWSEFRKSFSELLRSLGETAAMEGRIYPEEQLIWVSACVLIDHSSDSELVNGVLQPRES